MADHQPPIADVQQPRRHEQINNIAQRLGHVIDRHGAPAQLLTGDLKEGQKDVFDVRLSSLIETAIQVLCDRVQPAAQAPDREVIRDAQDAIIAAVPRGEERIR